MNRAALFCVLAALLSACTHQWVGRPVIELQRELGRPRRIQSDGVNQVYVYPDHLAGRGHMMTFTVDEKGIIRDWYATNDVPGVFGDDVFGVNDVGLGTVDTNGGFAR